MQIHELTPAQCYEILDRTTIARLACARDDQPYVVPVSVAFDAESNCLFGFSTVGKKVAWMRENPLVCVEIEDIADRFHWTTIIIGGRYEEITDAPEQSAARHRALDLFAPRIEWWLPGAARVGPGEHHAVVVYRIHIDTMTGRRAARERS
jgi:nitroimidazol reductase NimA-like FMN-containing flavoprotein (pyridoxamine 5'-phosphate oxidase superfamily)